MERESLTLIRTDALNLLLLFAGFGLFYFPGLTLHEFLRHTEADRTLIAWEMLERRDYLVPHLFGSVILTKPPFFYWLVALSMGVFGDTAEWVARIPSFLFSLTLIVAQYLFIRRVSQSQTLALLSAAVLGSSALFVQLATAGEIDAVFACLCGLGMFSAYFAAIEVSITGTILMHTFAALAFLTKAPPAFVFIYAPYLVYSAHLWFFKSRQVKNFSVSRIVGANVMGLAIFLLLVGTWLTLLGGQVGFSELSDQLRLEVFDRFNDPDKHGRGYLFYIGVSFQALLPWSLFLFLAPLSIYWAKKNGYLQPELPGTLKNALVFFCYVVVIGLLALSLSGGKSARYMLPLVTPLANLCAAGIIILGDSPLRNSFFKFGKYFALTTVLAIMGFYFFAKFPGVANLQFAVAQVSLVTALSLLGIACSREFGKAVMLSIFLVVISSRLCEILVYAPYQHSVRSTQDIVTKIDRTVGPNTPVYLVEIFERWIPYYLKRNGHDVLRITPALATVSANKPGTAYLLLSGDEELWRLKELERCDNNVQTIVDETRGRKRYLLIKTSAHALSCLATQERFPTNPSKATNG